MIKSSPQNISHFRALKRISFLPFNNRSHDDNFLQGPITHLDSPPVLLEASFEITDQPPDKIFIVKSLGVYKIGIGIKIAFQVLGQKIKIKAAGFDTFQKISF